MSRIKLRIAAILLVLLCSTATTKAAFWPTGSHTNDWTVISNWIENSAPATGLPGESDGIYMNPTSPTYPMAVLAGDTASCYWMYIGTEMNNPGSDESDTLDVYGTLNIHNPAITDENLADGYLIFGNELNLSKDIPPATVTVHEGGHLSTDEVWTRNADTTHTDYLVQNGGTITFDFILSEVYGIDFGKLACQINGGIFFLGRGNQTYGTVDYEAGTTSDNLTIDIAGGTLIMPQAHFDADITNGVILANGTTVTDPNTELYIDDISYRDVIWKGGNRGLIAVSNGVGGPSNAQDAYMSQWTMDDDAADTVVADSKGLLNGTMSENTNLHHNEEDNVEGTGSLEFDGVNDYITLPRDSVLETGKGYSELGRLSVSAWIKHDTSADNNATIIGTGTGGWYLGTLGADDTISFVCSLADPNGFASEILTVTSTTPIFDGQWHHVVAAFDGSQTQLYVDDEHTWSEETTLQAADIDNDGDNPVLIGENAGSPGSYWKGLIDDVRIYQFAMTSDEVYHWNHPKCAWNPNIPNGTQSVDPNYVALQWTPGDGADSHDVYFGKRLKADIVRDDGLSIVNNEDFALLASQWLMDAREMTPSAELADPNNIVDIADFAVMADQWQQTSLVYQGNIVDPNFVAATNASPLDPFSIYDWRIDEVDDDTGTTCTGRVWGFITEPAR